MWENKLINKNTNNKIKKILVGNKADLIERRNVSYKEGLDKKDELNFDGFCEVSAKNGNGIQELFKLISKLMYDDIINGDTNTLKKKIQNYKVKSKKNKKKCGC
jgi:Ras-related protein Rab-1A